LFSIDLTCSPHLNGVSIHSDEQFSLPQSGENAMEARWSEKILILRRSWVLYRITKDCHRGISTIEQDDSDDRARFISTIETTYSDDGKD
jgi:hypothetical protein